MLKKKKKKIKVFKGHLILLTDTLPLSWLSQEHLYENKNCWFFCFGFFGFFIPPLPLTDLESDCAPSCSLACPPLPRTQMPSQSLTKYHFPSTCKLLVSTLTASRAWGEGGGWSWLQVAYCWGGEKRLICQDSLEDKARVGGPGIHRRGVGSFSVLWN